LELAELVLKTVLLLQMVDHRYLHLLLQPVVDGAVIILNHQLTVVQAVAVVVQAVRAQGSGEQAIPLRLRQVKEMQVEVPLVLQRILVVVVAVAPEQVEPMDKMDKVVPGELVLLV